MKGGKTNNLRRRTGRQNSNQDDQSNAKHDVLRVIATNSNKSYDNVTILTTVTTGISSSSEELRKMKVSIDDGSASEQHQSPIGCELKVSAMSQEPKDTGGKGEIDVLSILSSASSSSESSLFTAYDEDEEESTIDSCYHGEERIRKHFEERDRRLRRMLIGKRRIYELSLMQQEQAVRSLCVESYRVKHHQAKNHPLGGNKTREDGTLGLSSRAQVKHNILFECQHSRTGVLIVLFYCLGNVTFYFLLLALLNYIYGLCQEYINGNLFDFLTCVSGVVMMRWTGYLWCFVEKETFDLVKIEMHNRERLGYLDAKVVRCLRGTRVKSFLNLLSFYLVFVSIHELYDDGVDKLFLAPIQQWYSSVIDDLGDLMSDGGEHATCTSFLKYIPNKSRGMIAYHLCMNDSLKNVAVEEPEATPFYVERHPPENLFSVENSFNLFVFLGATTVYGMLGLDFFDCCD